MAVLMDRLAGYFNSNVYVLATGKLCSYLPLYHEIWYNAGERWQYRMNSGGDKYITVHGCSIRYREMGDGPVLFLVHGIAGFLEEWEPSMKILAQKFRVIAVDLPGHGLSDKPHASYSITWLSAFLKDIIDAFGLSKFYLVGHSLGCAICLNLMIQHPHLVARLCLLNSAFIRIPFFLRLGSFRFLQHLPLKIPKFMIKASARRTFHKKEFITREWLESAHRYMNTSGAVRVLFSILHSNISLTGLDKTFCTLLMRGLEALNIPVLILYGDHDRIIPNGNSVLIHKCLKASECVEVRSCGHELQYESCDFFCAQAIRFFNSNEAHPSFVTGQHG